MKGPLKQSYFRMHNQMFDLEQVMSAKNNEEGGELAPA